MVHKETLVLLVAKLLLTLMVVGVPMVEVRLAKQRTGGDVEALLASRVKRIPLGFMGDGRDTANAALFLASDEARFITGTEIIVDGGMTARCD